MSVVRGRTDPKRPRFFLRPRFAWPGSWLRILAIGVKIELKGKSLFSLSQGVTQDLTVCAGEESDPRLASRLKAFVLEEGTAFTKLRGAIGDRLAPFREITFFAVVVFVPDRVLRLGASFVETIVLVFFFVVVVGAVVRVLSGFVERLLLDDEAL